MDPNVPNYGSPASPLSYPPDEPYPPIEPPKKPILRRVLVILVILLVVAGIGAVVFSLFNKKPAPKPTTTQKSSTSSSVNGIAVGTFRYVNACRLFTEENQASSFATLANDAAVNQTFAEDSLPTNLISSATGIQSTCNREFAPDSTYNDTNLTFTVSQYATTKAASTIYDAYANSQSNSNQANKQFGSSFVSDLAPLNGASNTLYSPTQHVSYTLADNKILSFSGTLANVTGDQFKQAIIKALPAVLINLSDENLKQQPVVPTDFDQKIGSTTKYFNPCSVFTSSEYQTMTGSQQDPTNVSLHYNNNATQYFFTNKSEGDANATCERTSYPGTKQAQDMTVEVEYFQSADEANQEVQQHMAAITADATLHQKVQKVTNVGSYAAYVFPTDTSTDSFFYAQKGAYVLKLHTKLQGDWGKKQYPDSDDYQKAINTLLVKLP